MYKKDLEAQPAVLYICYCINYKVFMDGKNHK